MINKNWKDYWKLAARRKENTAEHMVQYCILKALTAKGNNKVEIAEALIRAAFTPICNETKLANGRTKFDRLGHYDVQRAFSLTKHFNKVKPVRDIFGFDHTLIMDDDGVKAYDDLAGQIDHNKVRRNEPSYLFLFVRQDISKEQQAVQAAHAAFKAGRNGSGCPDNTNFVLIGVQNEYRLNEVVLQLEATKKIDFHKFVEPDLSDTLTAVATSPMKAHEKRFLKNYPLLTF